MFIIPGKKTNLDRPQHVEKLDLLLQFDEYIIYIVDMGC
jgi:hypothetical protein